MGIHLARPPMQVGGWGDATGRCCCRFTYRFSVAASRSDLKVHPPFKLEARRTSSSCMSELPPPPYRDALSSVITCTRDPLTAEPSSPPTKARVTQAPRPQAPCGPEVDEKEREEEGEEEEEKGSREEKFHDDMSINSLNDSGARTPLCRICFQGPEQGELLSPCRCSGSVRCSHEPCLVKWISERGSWSCEICYYKYHVVSISTKNPLQWRSITLTVIERVQMAAALLGSLFLLASVSWLVWSSLSPNARWQRRDLLFQICYAMYGFMDLVCIVLIIHEGPSVFRIFHRWQAVNQRWKVLNYDKARDLAEQQKPDAPPRRQPPLPAPSGRAPPSPSPPRHRQTGTAPSSRSSALLAAVAMTMTPAHPGVTSSPDPEEEEEERGGPAMEESEVTPTTAGGVTAGSEGENHLHQHREGGGGGGEGGGGGGSGGGGGGYRWTYSMLHLLGQRGAPGPQARSPSPPPPTPQTQGPRDPNRELVMRVTSL
ncbi:unnamed protein product [Gadus morhua 'NCC']